MAMVTITTTNGAVPPPERSALAAKLATLTYEAEGFAGSAVAPTVCWTLFDDRPHRAFTTGAGDPAAPLYYVEVTIIAGVMDKSTKHWLGESITSVLIAREADPTIAHDLGRVWVRFVEVADGDLIVGGESTSLASLKELIAQGG
jgi:phenylpyruvate tautomerase PptA (4-oxalocrotonate tautomerase family)